MFRGVLRHKQWMMMLWAMWKWTRPVMKGFSNWCRIIWKMNFWYIFEFMIKNCNWSIHNHNIFISCMLQLYEVVKVNDLILYDGLKFTIILPFRERMGASLRFNWHIDRHLCTYIFLLNIHFYNGPVEAHIVLFWVLHCVVS